MTIRKETNNVYVQIIAILGRTFVQRHETKVYSIMSMRQLYVAMAFRNKYFVWTIAILDRSFYNHETKPLEHI